MFLCRISSTNIYPAVLLRASSLFLLPAMSKKTSETPTAGCETPTPTPFYVPGSASIAYITTSDADAAKSLARGLIENQLAACVNIIPNVTSIYRWDGKLQEDSEVMMIVKTETSRVDALSEFVRRNHSYEVAEVISTKIENGNEPYLKFLHSAMNPQDKTK